jgi:hypothetical protein
MNLHLNFGLFKNDDLFALLVVSSNIVNLFKGLYFTILIEAFSTLNSLFCLFLIL